MKKWLFSLLVLLAVVVVTRTFNLTGIKSGTTSPTAGELLLTDQKQDKYKCMEECAKSQYQCEQQNKDKPGTKADNEWSAKCQEQYRICLDKCK